MTTKQETKKAFILWGFVAALVLLIAGALIFTELQSKNKQSITTFEECKEATGEIAESYPEQCFINGMSFSNPDQKVEQPTDGYIGLSEEEALSKAEQDNKQARVVERDGESLPVTMDYMPGRLNFYVSDGKIEKVQIEGAEE